MLSPGEIAGEPRRSASLGRGGPGAGRPAKVYTRSAREFAVTVPPREYELAARLLARAVEAEPEGDSQAALRRVAHQLGAELAARHRTGSGGGPQRCMEDVLTEYGFEPRHGEDRTVELRNCPFHQLAAQHPDTVCGMNLALIEGLVDGLDVRGLRPALVPGPGRCCVTIGVEDQ